MPVRVMDDMYVEGVLTGGGSVVVDDDLEVNQNLTVNSFSYSSDQTRYWSVAGTDFVPRDETLTYTKTNGAIGNATGGDDAVGPYIARQLKKTEVQAINCETVPENYTSVVKKQNPEVLIIIDAVEMGLLPGDIRIKMET